LGYRLINHTADLGIEVHSADAVGLFTQSALAMVDLMFDPGPKGKTTLNQIRIAGRDWPDLMVNWLREVLYFWTGYERWVTNVAILDVTPYEITAEIGWEKYNPHHHAIRHEIKAVTYHQIAAGPIEENPQGWRARIIFDL
jgi:SHS2 domain-containing protein